MTWPPPIIPFSDFDSDWPRYLEAIYRRFREDFVTSRPVLSGKTFKLKAFPWIDGKEATFWHLITSGNVEADRLPDLVRCERISWPRAMIECIGTSHVVWWRQVRGGNDRIMIALPDFSYVVILDEHREYMLLWTAYAVEYGHTRVKFAKQHAEFVKCRAAHFDD